MAAQHCIMLSRGMAKFLNVSSAKVPTSKLRTMVAEGLYSTLPKDSTVSNTGPNCFVEKALVEVRDNCGLAPLHCATYPEVAEFLVDKGSNLEAKPHPECWKDDGVCDATPILEAVRFQRYAVVSVLVAKSADLEAKDQDGKSALELADGNVQIQDLLRAALGKQKVLTLSPHRVQDDRCHIT